MTKTLTEQWREGTLPDGYYYIDYDTQQRIFEVEDGCATYQGLPAETYFLNDVCLIKVLAPVPSYDEYKELVGKTDKLEKMAFHYTPEEWNTMLRTIERLQEQLNEANEILDIVEDMYPNTIKAYFKKWGVK